MTDRAKVDPEMARVEVLRALSSAGFSSEQSAAYLNALGEGQLFSVAASMFPLLMQRQYGTALQTYEGSNEEGVNAVVSHAWVLAGMFLSRRPK